MIFEDTGRFGSKDACRTADKSISFTDMESLSDALAKRLCAYAGKRVVILGEDERVPAVMTACLKAGVCYVPCGGFVPEKRLETVIEGAGAEAVITTDACAGVHSAGIDAFTVEQILSMPEAGTRKTSALSASIVQ